MGATSADPDVSKWNTVNVDNMEEMFAKAEAAVPDMSRWDFTKVTCYAYLFEDVTLPTTTYSNILLRIAATSDKAGDGLCHEISCVEYEEEHDGPFGDNPPCTEYEETYSPLTAGQSKYNAAAAAARQELIDRGWLIKDGGRE